MYQFNYQGIIPADKPLITCVVPAGWRAKNLPTMGGKVAYVDKTGSMERCADYVFEFSELSQASSQRTICLDIHHRDMRDDSSSSAHVRIWKAPAKIYCRHIDVNDANNDWCIEVLLLNHFFGSCALTGAAPLDLSDIKVTVGFSNEFNFEFGIGETLSDALSDIPEHAAFMDASSAFIMMFCRAEKMRVDSCYQTMDSVMAFYSNATCIFGDVDVDQDKMLISVLVGH